MYIWIIEVADKWDDTPEGEWEFGEVEFFVAAEKLEEAVSKARNLSMQRTYENEEEGVIHKMLDVYVISIKRDKRIDA